jgi:hypothetical protein
MNSIHISVALLLSLVLGLSTTVSVAHNQLYHEHQMTVNVHGHLEKHTDDCHSDGLNHHDNHDESDCVFTVVQYTDSLLTHIIAADGGLLSNSKKAAVFISALIFKPKFGFLARAPPYRL